METEIVDLKNQLDNAVKEDDTDSIIALLKAISLFELTKDLLRTTMIGKSVGLLRNNKNESVSSESSALVLKWKKQLDLPSKPTTPTLSSPASPVTSADQASNKKRTSAKPPSSPSIASSSPEPSSHSKLTPSLKRKLDVNEDNNNNNKSSDNNNNNNSGSVKKEQSSIPIKKQPMARPVELPYMSDDMRSKTMKLLADSLQVTEPTVIHYNEAAASIENELFAIHEGCTSEYKAKIRSIIMNLKMNTQLRDSILSDNLGINRFCKMDATV
ncbi:hypothetical protein SAMD00019534_101380 [Acytostelium subglobosum LB1]|uniref:hypothetical protein n=1 Tax=Acytostelium subglobosum LB1 TaxID=1410327 RepID=UPI0006449E6F|nr:hypothetical protein SAMD00019534_101380 [Acytostelium subglobosum LB1]GAM26963.1 hypothetical protein SAMD00019534_101380 [Acytostelium subglobosum LB1]|eukprot:XP_012750231.1 hypothetical protein SAMD00019534_101380 [Acytostelium subglobosum LB1]